jgi:mannobiose 2-epimerase
VKSETTLRSEIEANLRDTLEVWFPRTVDGADGGFFCDFDHRWHPAGRELKMLEYQARQALAATLGAKRFPDEPSLRDAAVHGFEYLKGPQWDAEYGGWYRMLDHFGAPTEAMTKHGHGSSYAIAACAACYELTGDPDCLELAVDAFEWLDAYTYDRKNGGYFGYCERNGTPVLSVEQNPIHGRDRDCIGTPFGLEDANTTCDLLKCFCDLHRIWPDVTLRARIGEIHRLVVERLVVAPGVMHMYALPDWTPVPEIVRYGHVLRSANILLEAEKVIGDEADASVAKSMIDTMLRVAWDEKNAGFFLAGTSIGPAHLGRETVFFDCKIWWLQAEGLAALAVLMRKYPDDPAGYSTLFEKLWTYVCENVIDAKRGGWMGEALDSDHLAARRPKATMWKDCSHEVEALLCCLDVLGD